MPDARGKLLAADYEKITAWWGLHWKDPVVCPVCRNTVWVTAPHIVSTYRSAGDGLFGSPSYPHILVMCTTCSHTMFFNAVKIGLVESYQEHSEQEISPLPLPSVGTPDG
jgi:hypothetical protein